jgi:hypothetical protein
MRHDVSQVIFKVPTSLTTRDHDITGASIVGSPGARRPSSQQRGTDERVSNSIGHSCAGAPMIIASNLKTLAAVTVATTATKLGNGSGGAANAGVMVQAPSSNTASVFVGDSAVTTSTGLEIEPGRGVTLPIQDESNIYGIVASGTQNLRVLKLI